MKRSKITILLAIVLGMTFHSCLDLEPQDQLGGKNMWTSVNDYKQFANTFYSWTRDFSSVVYDGTQRVNHDKTRLVYNSRTPSTTHYWHPYGSNEAIRRSGQGPSDGTQ